MKQIQIILLLMFSMTIPIAQALQSGVIYDGQNSVEKTNVMIYGQVPLSNSIFSTSQFPPIPNSLISLLEQKNLVTDPAEGVGTPTLNTDLGEGHTGYVGYSNYDYNISLNNLDLGSILTGSFDAEGLINSGTFELVDPDFPILDPTQGFNLEFNVAVTSESSNPNRAGFNVLIIADNGQGIELGFKREEGGDRIFAQSANFKEAEDTQQQAEEQDRSLNLDLSMPTDYVLTVQGENYSLTANGTEILNGPLRQYQFEPAKSSPPLMFNPYESPNFLFFGDNSDQSSAMFTLNWISWVTFEEMFDLGEAFAFDREGHAIGSIETYFMAGMTIGGEIMNQIDVEQRLSDEVMLTGQIQVDPAHIDQLADIILYANYDATCEQDDEAEEYYMVADGGSQILHWNEDPIELLAFQKNVKLQSQHPLTLYHDYFISAGCLYVSFGYLLQSDGTIIVNNQTINFNITE